MTGRDIQIVLEAVAFIEGWDSARPSVTVERGGNWRMRGGLPVPSRKLVKMVREVERRVHAREGKLKPVRFSRAELDAICSMAAIAGAGSPDGDYADWTPNTYSAADRAHGKALVLMARLERGTHG